MRIAGVMEQRIRYLLEAALRADQEGDVRTARILRRIAEESQPLVASQEDDASTGLACSGD